MPALKKMLQAYDLDLIERICSTWGVEPNQPDLSTSINALMAAMQDTVLVNEVIESLPQSAREAWNYILNHSQKLTWSQFTRKFGEVREFGPAKREREEPEIHPVSAAETLWYRGLIGRAFLNLPPEPREFVYIPDELIKRDSLQKSKSLFPPIKKTPADLIKTVFPADGRLIDHMTDWLAARRMGLALSSTAWQAWPENEIFISTLSKESDLVNSNLIPDPETLAVFLQQDRNEVLHHWFKTWLKSHKTNDLKSLPGLTFEGEWQNDPLQPRQFVLEILQTLEMEKWFDLASFVGTFKSHQPDFQRPSGDYDSWFISRSGTKQFLRGYEHWDQVDGALLRYFLCGPLHWLGMVDLAQGQKNSEVSFRLTPLFNFINSEEKPPLDRHAEEKIKINVDLSFSVPLFASRLLRYQIARFCDIRSISSLQTDYEITPNSLEKAQASGLSPKQLVQLLEKHNKGSIPRSLTLLAEQWEKTGRAAEITEQVILRTKSPEIMQFILGNQNTSKFILEQLSPQVAVINKNGVRNIKKILLDLGYLTDINLDV